MANMQPAVAMMPAVKGLLRKSDRSTTGVLACRHR